MDLERPIVGHGQDISFKLGKSTVSSAKGPTQHVTGLLVALCIVALCALIAFGALPRIIQQKLLVDHTKAEMAEAPYVSVVKAQPGAPIEEFTLPGTTQAIQDAPIYARVDGYLRDRYVNIGDIVHTGQVLADIDTPELDQQVAAAASAVEQARANLDNAQQALDKAKADEVTAAANVQKAKTDLQYYTAELGRYKELSQEGAVSYEDRDTKLQAYNGGVATLDALTWALKSAQATVKSATAAVHVAQAAMNAAQAQHDQYEATRSFKKVRAGFDGVVTQRNVDAGALITSGSNSSNTLMFEIAKTDVLRVFVYVPEQYVEFIRQGEQAILNFQEYQDHDFVGLVANVSGGVDPTSKTLQVEIHVKNSDHKLLPGMYAQVRFQCPAQIRLPVVPATTVQTRADGEFMYTVDSAKHLHMHKIEIGRDLGGFFEIARGITPGDIVVINPSDQLREGMLVNTIVAPVEMNKNGKVSS
jgi:RND family efflux transporter MFP subunit